MIEINFKEYEFSDKIGPHAINKILSSRGIPLNKQERWINAGEGELFSWHLLDEERMIKAANLLQECVKNKEDIIVNVDPDCDGFTSAAIIINYLYGIDEDYAKNHIHFILHKGKEHGLKDIIDDILSLTPTPRLVLCPDSSSNDCAEHERLTEAGIAICCLDHHECEQEVFEKSPAIIINVNTCDYPNKALTGAGVAYKFIEACEELWQPQRDEENKDLVPSAFIDLCALGNCGDMSDYRELETRAFINLGFNDKHTTNPFFRGMWHQNKFSIDGMNGLNYYSAAFYIVPFVNALVRSGTMEEKELIFKSMLLPYAFEQIPSSKRGHKGEMVTLWEEAVLVAGRVKRRQTKLQDESMELLESRIAECNLVDNAIIILLCKPGEVEKNLAGLVANKIQAKYQHPTLVLTEGRDKDSGKTIYRGSARNYSMCEKSEFKDICEQSGFTDFVAGHQGAFGIGIYEDSMDSFIDSTNKIYGDIDFTPVYWVDYIWKNSDLKSSDIGDLILEIAELNIYGQEVPESSIAIKDIAIFPQNITLMSPDKRPTLKIRVGNIDIIKFKSSQEEYEKFLQPDLVLNGVCKCKKNEWMGRVSPQLILEDYELEKDWVF